MAPTRIVFVFLSICWSAALGEQLKAKEACAAKDGSCEIFEDGAPLVLMQNNAAGIAAKGASSLEAPKLAAVQEKAEAPSAVGGASSLEAPKLAAVQEKAEAPSAVGGAGASSKSAGAAKAAEQLKSSPKLSGVAFALWAFLAVALVAMGIFIAAKMGEGVTSAMLVAEFIGTFMLVFSVGCNVLVGDPTWGVLSIACTLMVAIYALGSVSGGNFNPAVSCALALSAKMPWTQCASYVCVQLAAGIAAGIAYSTMLGESFALGPADGYTATEAGLAEVLYTFMLCFVVLNTAASEAHAGKEQFYGLAIGFVVVAGGYGAGAISGGCFNPAVALGIDSAASSSSFGWSMAYFAFEAIGALLAALLFRACRPGDFGGNETPGLPTKCLSEFLGTFLLVLTVGLNVLASSPAAVFSIAASLMCMIFALGSVSGAHFNPAVTFAIILSGREIISLAHALAYMVAQVVGGVLAAFLYVAMQNGKSVALKPSGSSGKALFGELMFTFLLAFVVLSVATVKSPLSHYFGLAIGSCVTAGGLAIGSLSGGSLNPAVSAGLSISDMVNGGSLAWLPSYAVAELAGGAVAAAAFRATHAAEYSKY